MSKGYKDVKRQEKSRIEQEVRNMQSSTVVEFKMVAMKVAPRENSLNNTLSRILKFPGPPQNNPPPVT